MMETAHDIDLFDDGHNGYREHVHEKAALDIAAIEEGLAMKAIAAAESALDESLDVIQAAEVAQIEAAPEDPPPEDDVAMIEASVVEAPEVEPLTPVADENENPEPGVETENGSVGASQGVTASQSSTALQTTTANAELDDQDQIVVENGAEKVATGMELTAPEDESVPGDQDEDPAPRRMRTRAQAQAASDENTVSRNRSMTPESNESYVHPYFLPPPSAHPDRDMGLPTQEADDTRRLLQLYIQKQEEVVRGIERLYTGLMKADRMRAEVFKWAKADGHIGEMSDGEDWYDKEEWGLTEDLKKGQDEEEEDAATTAKKTRTRRQ